MQLAKGSVLPRKFSLGKVEREFRRTSTVRPSVRRMSAAVRASAAKEIEDHSTTSRTPVKPFQIGGRLPLIGNAHQVDLLKLYEKIEDWHQEHGEVFEIQAFDRFAIYTSNAEDIQQVLKNAETFPKTVSLLEIIGEWLGDGLATRANIERHAEMRRILNPAFRIDYIKGLSPVFGEIGDKLADGLLRMGKHDIQDMSKRATIDIIGRTGFRYDFGSLDLATGARSSPVTVSTTKNGPLDVAAVFDKIFSGAGKLIAFSFLPRAITPGYREYKESIGQLNGVIDTVLAERRSQGVKPTDLDLISYCVRAMEVHPDIMDSQQIREELHTMLFAGSDTTANTLSWMFYVLAQQPEMLARCTAEADALLASDDVTLSPDILNATLPYITACFKETLRLYPPVVILTRNASHDTVLEGSNTAIEEGALCSLNIWSVQRSPKYWKQPLEFKPERWLPEGLEEFGPVQEDAFVAFGGGSRVCIGKFFAIMEGQILASKVLHKVKFEPVPGFKPRMKSTMTLTSTNGIWLTALPRDSSAMPLLT